MQQNGEQQQEYEHPQQPPTLPEQAIESKIETDSSQAEQQLTTEQQKTEECLDLLRRTQADFINYRRRTSQEQAEVRSTAQSALLVQLLPVLDDLGRALEAAPSEFHTHPWVQGLFLVARRLATQLEQLGVRPIGAQGERFDPHRHEAVTAEASTDLPEGTVLHVIQPGYALGERIIRPAQVSVASRPVPIHAPDIPDTPDAPAPQEDASC